ncbi:MAG TPA: alpha/beta hydrolase [Desulfatiglandales bacterium]|nr:alpha/beta hydrolase [Desulfatiglandales bacterium]
MKEIALVLLPGLDGTGELFGPFMDCIPEGIKPVVISYPRDRRCSYVDLKAIIMEAIPRETDFFILGESFSGPLAIMIAGQRPERLKGLILCATFIRNPFRFVPSWISFISIGYIYRLWPLLIRIRTVYQRDQIKKLARMAIEVIKTVKPEVIAGRVKSIFRVDVEKELRSCDLPILYIMGDEDRLIRKHNFEKIKKIRHDIILKVIKTRHFILQLEPMEAAKELIEFMDKAVKTG